MNIKNLAIGIAIMILTLFVVMYGINTIYSEPKYEDYCNSSIIKSVKIIENKEKCIENNGKWNSYDTPLNNRTGYCDSDYYCRQDYDNANENYYKNIFLITLPIGILIILIGMFLFGLEFVGSGLIGGGVLSIIYGVGSYWRYSEDVLKFILSFIGLIIVILAAYKFNKTGALVFKKKK
ncbi:MAG: hypothetical protein ACOC3Z_00695 [Nanoarchaeota archaeon]